MSVDAAEVLDQAMAQEDSGDFVEEVAKEFNVPIYN